MLVQLLTKGIEVIDDQMAQTCCSIVDVCTGAIDVKWIILPVNGSNRTIAQYDFATKSLIAIMVRYHRKRTAITTIWSKMQKHGIWMMHHIFKSISNANIECDWLWAKIPKYDCTSEYSQHKITCCFQHQKERKWHQQKSFDMVWLQMILCAS